MNIGGASMKTCRTITALTAAMLTGLAIVSAQAEQQAPAQTMEQLLGEGFEIKGQSVIPLGVAQRIGDTTWQDGLLVTLQKGSVLAFCHYGLKSTRFPSGLTKINSCSTTR